MCGDVLQRCRKQDVCKTVRIARVRSLDCGSGVGVFVVDLKSLLQFNLFQPGAKFAKRPQLRDHGPNGSRHSQAGQALCLELCVICNTDMLDNNCIAQKAACAYLY
jgi:hypothetical protein